MEKATAAGIGGALATRFRDSTPRAAALEEAALIRAAAAADVDSFGLGGLTESRWERDFPSRPFMPAPLVRMPPEVDTPDLTPDRTLGAAGSPTLLFGHPGRARMSAKHQCCKGDTAKPSRSPPGIVFLVNAHPPGENSRQFCF